MLEEDGVNRMFITSETLTERISKISKEVDIQTGHTCLFEEFVAVPCFGQIVLRFNAEVICFTSGA